MKYRNLLWVLLCMVSLCGVSAATAGDGVRTGADQLEKWIGDLRGKRVAMVVNQTSVTGGRHLFDTLYARGVKVNRLFAPEHGFRGNADAGETVRNARDVRTGVPVTSLYGKNKKPTGAQLQDADIVIFDIQDVGARFYTYISTMYYVMDACAEHGKEVWVLDRPNPCDYVDGPVRKAAFKSFVGMLPIPLLHGCTVGELAQMINGEGWLSGKRKCKLRVVKVEGWKHGQPYSLPVKPSPNLPNDQSIALYPSLCPFEATPVSVGRGTRTPFQVAGLPGLKGQPYSFMPVSLPGFDKHPLHQGKRCYGLDLRKAEAPRGFSLQYVFLFYRLMKEKLPEQNFFSRPQWFDLLMGTDQVRKGILTGKTEEQIRAEWRPELERYRKMRAKYLLY